MATQPDSISVIELICGPGMTSEMNLTYNQALASDDRGTLV